MDNKIVSQLPSMKSEKEVYSALLNLPMYDGSICQSSATERLIALSDIYDIYIPSEMTYEIYSKLYLALLNSLKKKSTRAAVIQQGENTKAIRNTEHRGILGGSDSFTVIGTSGIGKTTAIYKSIELITENRVIEINFPYTKIIPCLVVQCPFDSSVKGLLLEILRKADEILNSRYYENALRARATTDMLIGSVSQVALNHIGLLVVDEIQNVVGNKNGQSLVGMLTQLINNSGISICMVGTPKCKIFFEKEMQLARRSLGLEYGAEGYNDFFFNFCRTLFEFQYTKNRGSFTDEIGRWLYEHSGGIVSVVVSLIHDAQEIAILDGSEELNTQSLNKAYKKRMSLMRGYIDSPPVQKHYTQRSRQKISENNSISNNISISRLAEKAKTENADFLALLKENYTVTEAGV